MGGSFRSRRDLGSDSAWSGLVRIGALSLLFYSGCLGGRTTLLQLEEESAGTAGAGTGGIGGKGGGGSGGNSGGAGGSIQAGAGGGPAGTGGAIFCDPSPCANSGVCVSYPGGYYCSCPAGYEGFDCSVDIDECAGNPCRNGKCVDQVARFECVCDPGYAGTYCERDIDDCASMPCKNGGACVDRVDGYDCLCPSGFSGHDCQNVDDPCSPNPCKNSGICSGSGQNFSCACPAGYTGALCETAVGDCGDPNPCLNGGTCSLVSDVPTCSCPAGWSLPYCQCRGNDEPQLDGSCLLSTVCGKDVPDAFAGGDCSSNTDEFPDWWCQLGGYEGARSFTLLTSGLRQALFYPGGAEQVLSVCAQVEGPQDYGLDSSCTAAGDLACTGAPIDASLRPNVMLCGTSDRDVRTFFPAGANLALLSGCAPTNDTQALMVTRYGASAVSSTLRGYLQGGGIVITEYSVSAALWNVVFPDIVPSAIELGGCLDNVPTVVQFSPMDRFWIDNPFVAITQSESGCGFSVSGYPFITPLAGWDANHAGLGYRNVGRGRFWAADFDWQDFDRDTDTLRSLMGYMLTHRR